ncbi:uridylate kinase [Diplodia corticola]|uniref:Uridylate kinase n=1 Tax=Diplodia corticola TaxID=236234 RepID=A0A1J9S5N6_9PEZI|nr:uridylate kinase [Diplodia corticola]OJD40275.1 uridylate kinase [Diplodia corticola]
MGTPRSFAVVFVLGAPGAGKGTLCSHLAQTSNLAHYSVGDSLRAWMRDNKATPLAVAIQDKLDNQGFLTSDDLNPFIRQAIKDAMRQNGARIQGILVDGFPRCTEQLESFNAWPFQDDLPLAPTHDANAKPDIVLSIGITKANAKARYVARARDSNDSLEKFERRFAEYEAETMPVEQAYRQRGVLIDVDANGTKEENVKELTKKLEESRRSPLFHDPPHVSAILIAGNLKTRISRTNAVAPFLVRHVWAVKALYRLLLQASAPVAVPLVRLCDGPASVVDMACESSPHVLVRGATLEQLVEQPVLVAWHNDANGQYEHIGCLSTAAPRDRANLTFRVGRAGFGSHQRLLISFHLPVCTRATQRKTEKNMFLIVPAERLRIQLDLVDFDTLPPPTRGQLRNNHLGDTEAGLVRARFSLMTSAYVLMPKLRRPLARPLTGAPGRLMSSLRALSEAKEFDVYLSRGDVEHRLQKICSTLHQHPIETPDLDINATFDGGYSGGKNLWESYPFVGGAEYAWNPMVDEAPPPYDAVLGEDVSPEPPPAVEKIPPQPVPGTSGRRVVSWNPDRHLRAEIPSIFQKSEPSKIKQLLMSWSPESHVGLADVSPPRPSAAIAGHKRRVRSDGAILGKTEARFPPRPAHPDPTAAYDRISEAATSNIGSPEITQPADARHSDSFGDEKSIISAYSTAPSYQKSSGASISPSPQPPTRSWRADSIIANPPSPVDQPDDDDHDAADPPSPMDHRPGSDHPTASLLRAAVLASLHARSGPSADSSATDPPDPALLHTPNLFLELQEWLAVASSLDPLAHETHRAALFALGAAAREGLTTDFDSGMRDCQRALLRDAWREWPPAENMLEDCFEVLDWLNGAVCRNAGTVMMPMLVGLRAPAQDVGMMGAGDDGAEKAWREALAEVRAAAFWVFG